MEDAHGANTTNEVDCTSKYLKTAVSNHLIPFRFSEEDCDVLLKAKDNTMVVPAVFLGSISECFERKFVRHGGMVKMKGDTNNKIRNSLEMTHLYLKNVIQALSFYFPPQMIPLSDSSDFDELLLFATDHNLLNFKDDVEKFLIETHTVYKNTLLFNNEKLKILKIADNFGLAELRRGLLRKENIILSSATKNKEFQNLINRSRFEILKNTFLARFKLNSKESTLKKAELHLILNFFDLLINENRTVDFAVKNCPIRRNESFLQDVYLLFQPKNTSNEVVVNVEGGSRKFYVDSFTLTQNSPVLKNMLKKGDSKIEIILELPQKNLNDMIQFVSFLKNPKDIAEVKNLSAFSALCEEFKVEWVKDRIKDYLENLNIDEVFDQDLNDTQLLLMYLEIASKLDFEDAEKNLVDQLHESFVFIQMYPEFSALSTKTKILVARKRLCFLLNFCSRKSKNLYLNTESAGLLSVLVNYQQKPIHFQYNSEEKEEKIDDDDADNDDYDDDDDDDDADDDDDDDDNDDDDHDHDDDQYDDDNDDYDYNGGYNSNYHEEDGCGYSH